MLMNFIKPIHLIDTTIEYFSITPGMSGEHFLFHTLMGEYPAAIRHFFTTIPAFKRSIVRIYRGI